MGAWRGGGPALDTFDDRPLRLFSRDKVVLSVRDRFFLHGEVPHPAFVVVYRLVPPSHPDGSSGKLEPGHGQAHGQPRDKTAPSATDLRAGLAPEHRARFDLLRDWRNRTAQDEGLPAYAVLTNKQLLAVTRDAPSTRAAPQRVEGLGTRRAERYGHAILAITAPASAPAAGPA